MGRKEYIKPVGGNPSSLEYWLYSLRLPANKHRIADLMVKKADTEDGCLWYGEDWLAFWSGFSVRNVGRIIRALEAHKQPNGEPVLKVWRLHRRASVYQLQCPELPKLHDLARVELMRGVNLGEPDALPDKLSSKPCPTDCPAVPDKSGPESEGLPDKSGPEGDPNCPTEVLQEELPENNEVDQGKDPPPSAGEAGAPAGPPPSPPERIDYQWHADSWNETAVPLGFPRVEVMNQKRKDHIKARYNDKPKGVFDWEKILAKLPDAVGGWHHRTGVLDFDFMIKNTHGYTRLLEGRCDPTPGEGAPPARTPSYQEDAIERARRARNG